MKLIVTVEDGQLQVLATEGMDMVDMTGMLAIAQHQVLTAGPTGWLASATIEQPSLGSAQAELKQLLGLQRHGR